MNTEGFPHATPRSGKVLEVELGTEQSKKVAKALGSDNRIAIVALLQSKVLNVSEIAEALGSTVQATSDNVMALADAGLISTKMIPGTRGAQKACSRAVDAVVINFPEPMVHSGRTMELSMPIGGFNSFDVHPTCGLVSKTGVISMFDDARSFYEPSRVEAQLIWFHHGFVEYRFPNRLLEKEEVENLQVAMEVCSEAPLYNENWPSDIVVSINDRPLGTWTCPGDFGGKRGMFTPEWWSTSNTQFGLMKVWKVGADGSYIDGERLSDVTLDDLNLGDSNFISVRIEVPADAPNVGGINLFGKEFGNYPQDLVLRIQTH